MRKILVAVMLLGIAVLAGCRASVGVGDEDSHIQPLQQSAPAVSDAR